MSNVTIELDENLIDVLHTLDQPVREAVRELVVFELYRRAAISSGKAAELLGMPLADFIQYSGDLGIPFFRMSEDEWADEVARIEKLCSKDQ